MKKIVDAREDWIFKGKKKLYLENNLKQEPKDKECQYQTYKAEHENGVCCPQVIVFSYYGLPKKVHIRIQCAIYLLAGFLNAIYICFEFIQFHLIVILEKYLVGCSVFPGLLGRPDRKHGNVSGTKTCQKEYQQRNIQVKFRDKP